jgi:hypothetical protein
MLRVLQDALDLSWPMDAAIFAAACITSWGQCRLGELLRTAWRRHDACTHLSSSSIAAHVSIGTCTQLSLLHTKTSGARGGMILLTRRHGCADSTYALPNHFHVNCWIPPCEYLFAHQAAWGGPVRGLTCEPFMDHCNALRQATGLPKMTCHCFRIGGTNAFLAAGVHSDVVSGKGRWKSDALFVHGRNKSHLALAHTE